MLKGHTATYTEDSSPRAEARVPYDVPALQHLGSVRELVLGATGVRNDMRGGRKP